MIYQQSVFELWQIESESVQAICTSPPYYALRKYSIPDVIIGGDKKCQHEFQADICIHCNAWKGQYGLEPTPALYVEHTRLWAKEAWRVLRNEGIMMLNLADSYSGSGCGTNGYRTEASKSIQGIGKNVDLYKTGGITQKLKDYPKKCQLLIPHRVAISLVEDGWILRNTIIWYKTNPMPESVTDRFSKKYEYIFMFTKQEKYYFDLDAVREPHKEVSIKRLERAVSNNNKWVNGADGQGKQGLSQPRPNYKDRIGSMQNTDFEGGDYLCGKLNPLGKNPGDVWIIPTQPSSEKHFAMWPERLVERMIRCSTRPPREIDGELLIDAVLDPFCGSGTTLKVAQQLCREPLGIDLGYHEISKRRTFKIQLF